MQLPCATPSRGLNAMLSAIVHARGSGLRKWLTVQHISNAPRSLRHLVNSLAELEGLGVAFVSLRDNLDLSTPSGRLMFQIIGAMAEFERALMQERVKAGLRNARAKGRRLGRPRADLSETQVAALRASGATLRAIAKELGVGVGTIHRLSRQKA
jgi:DNA invertase Pin-like site-specific DNA recombinase